MAQAEIVKNKIVEKFPEAEILFTIKEVENRRIRKVSVKSFANKNEEAD